MPMVYAANGWPAMILSLSFCVLCFLIGVWDVWASASGHQADTVSNWFGTWGSQYPILPLIIGLILGHVFWPRNPVQRPQV